MLLMMVEKPWLDNRPKELGLLEQAIYTHVVMLLQSRFNCTRLSIWVRPPCSNYAAIIRIQVDSRDVCDIMIYDNSLWIIEYLRLQEGPEATSYDLMLVDPYSLPTLTHLLTDAIGRHIQVTI